MKKKVNRMNDNGLLAAFLNRIFALYCGMCLLASGVVMGQSLQLERPYIMNIQINQDEVLVRAFVPGGYKQVFVE